MKQNKKNKNSIWQAATLAYKISTPEENTQFSFLKRAWKSVIEQLTNIESNVVKFL